MHKDKYTAFLVDDSPDDRLFMRKALEQSSNLVVMGEACDGQEIIDYLGGEGSFGDRETYPLPDLLILDLQMPRKGGFDVLWWLKTHSFKNLTVAVVSDSALPEDISKSLALGADGHFRKTSVREEHVTMLCRFKELVEKRAGNSSHRLLQPV